MLQFEIENEREESWLANFVEQMQNTEHPNEYPGHVMADNIRSDVWDIVREILQDQQFTPAVPPFSDEFGSGTISGSYTTLYSAGDLVHIGPPQSPGGGGNGGGGNGGGGNGGGGDGGSLLTVYTSGMGDGGYAVSDYNVQINFLGDGWTDNLQQIFIDQAEYLSSIITGDIVDAFAADGTLVDDISINASIENIDGKGGILGMAGWDELRAPTSDDPYLPLTGTMIFDARDAGFYDKVLGLFDEIVLHEMMHAIGVGTIWEVLGLIDTTGDFAVFTGTNAMAAYSSEFGGSGGVPVEEDYGAGTAFAHWDEETFDTELMTGIIDANSYVSDMTIASIEDLGYETTWGDLIA